MVKDPSKRPAAKVLLSGENSSAYVQSDCPPSVLISARSGARKILMVLSAEEETSVLPSGDQASFRMASSCAINVLRSFPDFSPRDQMRMLLSRPAAATIFPVGSMATVLIP